MIPSLLITNELPVVVNDRAHNIINGNDAELLAGARVLFACNAEISWGSRNEDGSKIDLFASYDHPWFMGERIILLIQVKSGPTYGQIMGNGFELTQRAKLLAKRTSHEICVIWVDRVVSKLFWAYIHPNTALTNQFYGKHHRVNPAMRFDIARCQSKYLPYKLGGAGVIIARLAHPIGVARKIALRKYRELSRQNILCPVIGKVEFTRMGWRHMFRKARSQKDKASSMDVIRQLDSILIGIPTNHSVTKTDYFVSDNYEYRVVEHLLSYEKVKLFDGGITKEIKVIIKLKEEVRYPTNWHNDGMLSQKINRRVVFLSAYHKNL